jgi:prepilin-type processing-associated H-X9-DG protein
MYSGGLTMIAHQNGSSPAGLNAGFADGHVAWQGVRNVPNAFDTAVWSSIGLNSGAQSCTDMRYVQSCWQP